MDSDKELAITGLEERVLDILENNIDDFLLVCDVPKPVRMAFKRTRTLFSAQNRPHFQVLQHWLFTLIQDKLLLFLHLFFIVLILVDLLHLFLKFFDLLEIIINTFLVFLT